MLERASNGCNYKSLQENAAVRLDNLSSNGIRNLSHTPTFKLVTIKNSKNSKWRPNLSAYLKYNILSMLITPGKSLVFELLQFFCYGLHEDNYFF